MSLTWINITAQLPKGEFMSLGLLAFFVALPLISAGVLLVGFRLPARVAPRQK